MNNKCTYCSTFNLDFSETIAYNNPLFPALINYGMLSTYPDYSGVTHWHKDLEFILIKRGNMTYNVNGELIPLTEGNGIMVNSRQLQQSIKNANLSAFYFHRSCCAGTNGFIRITSSPLRKIRCILTCILEGKHGRMLF